MNARSTPGPVLRPVLGSGLVLGFRVWVKICSLILLRAGRATGCPRLCPVLDTAALVLLFPRSSSGDKISHTAWARGGSGWEPEVPIGSRGASVRAGALAAVGWGPQAVPHPTENHVKGSLRLLESMGATGPCDHVLPVLPTALPFVSCAVRGDCAFPEPSSDLCWGWPCPGLACRGQSAWGFPSAADWHRLPVLEAPCPPACPCWTLHSRPTALVRRFRFGLFQASLLTQNWPCEHQPMGEWTALGGLA